MPAIPHVVRRGAVYYWRRRMPSMLAESPRSATLLVGLRTRDPRRARFLAGQITALADRLFVDAMEQRLDHSQLQAIFRSAFTRHLDKLEAVVARERVEPDFDAEDSRRSDEAMAWVYRLLETRGAKAQVDDRARAQMKDCGLDDQAITEIDLTLDAMRKNGLVHERPARLEAAIAEVGGVPSPINQALSQQTIFRALSAANFETARRYDGLRSEQTNDIDLILRDRYAENEMARATNNSPSRRAASVQLVDTRHESSGDVEVTYPKRRAAPDRSALTDTVSVSDALARPPKKAAQNKKHLALRWEDHPIVLLGAKLCEKNKAIWDPKTQRQAAQIYGLLGKVLCEQAIYDVADIRQTHFADLDDLLASVAKSYGKSSKDQARTTAQLRAIGAAKPQAERGLAPETLNRHFTFLNQLLPFMRSRGLTVDREIDISLLRALPKIIESSLSD